LLSHHPELC